MCKSLSVLIAALILPVLGAKQFAPPDLSMPETYVDDRAHVVNAEQAHALNGILQELEQKTGVQYIILTVDSTGGLPIEQFSIELLDKWKLGQKGKDNGLFDCCADRAYRFGKPAMDWYASSRTSCGRDGDTGTYSGVSAPGICEANLPVIGIADGCQVKLTGCRCCASARQFRLRRGGTGGMRGAPAAVS
jgi:hypothetical protein